MNTTLVIPAGIAGTLPRNTVSRASVASTSVTEFGAIILPGGISVDGFSEGEKVRIITHIHSDHLLGLGKSIRYAGYIAATPITLDLLAVYGYRIPPSKRLAVSYGTLVKVPGTSVRFKLLRARHIPGSASVLAEAEDGVAGYTGDFKLPGTDIMTDVDVLVVDATYGLPEYVRPWQEEMDFLLADIVLDILRLEKPVTIYAYNGKIEEVMLILREHGVDAPFLVTSRHYRLLKVLEKYGFRIGDVVVETSTEGREVERSGWYIRFRHYNYWWSGMVDGFSAHVLLTGWEFKEPYRWVGKNRLIVSFSDHADFRQLVEYVRESRPRRVIVDAYRGGRTAHVFALYLRRKLNIPAEALPG